MQMPRMPQSFHLFFFSFYDHWPIAGHCTDHNQSVYQGGDLMRLDCSSAKPMEDNDLEHRLRPV